MPVPRLMVDLSPLRESRDFRLLFSGQFVSVFGSQLTMAAIPWQVYLTTHSSLWVGAVSLIQLPLLIVGALWGGAVSDRVDKRAMLSVCALVQLVASAALAINASFAHPSFAVLLALAAIWAGIGGFANPARNAAIPKLVGPDRLIPAYSLNQVTIQFATIAGPATAGVLIGAVGLRTCYVIDSLTFAVLAIATYQMSPMPPSGATSVSAWRSVRDGFAYVRTHVFAQCVYLIDLNAMIFGMPTALFPAVASSWYHGGPVVYGLLMAAPGAGALIGAVTTGWVERVRRRGRAVVLAVALWGASIAIFGLVKVLWVGLVFLAVAGWADVISAVLRNTILQSSITDEYRGRLSAIQIAVVTGGPRLGNFEAGAVATVFSTEVSIVSGGLACIAGAVALVRWRPQFWRAESEF